jgi:hypothetical protein
MINIRILNELDNEELWYSEGAFITGRRNAQAFESVALAEIVAEAISAGMEFVVTAFCQEDMESADSSILGFEEIQVVDGDKPVGNVKIYAEPR